jgi:hypothetical protein
MNSKIFLISYLVVIFLVSIFPSLWKELFVPQTGNIKIIGPVIGFFLAFGIYHKWKHIDKIFYVVFGLVLGTDLFLLFSSNVNNFIAYLILSIAHLSILLVFIYSKSIKAHLNS